MADHGIIFSAPMVLALLAGRKSQTRRALSRSWSVLGYSWKGRSHDEAWGGLRFAEGVARQWPGDPHLAVPWRHPSDEPTTSEECGLYKVRPPIEAGDRLWVREAWSHTGAAIWTIADARMRGRGGVIYRAEHGEAPADGPRVDAKWWPSIHMPREFSRLTLTVTDVRVQRLQAISEADAIAEGCRGFVSSDGNDGTSPREEFQDLWNSLHGPDAWKANPWVAVYGFSVAQRNIDAEARHG